MHRQSIAVAAVVASVVAMAYAVYAIISAAVEQAVLERALSADRDPVVSVPLAAPDGESWRAGKAALGLKATWSGRAN